MAEANRKSNPGEKTMTPQQIFKKIFPGDFPIEVLKHGWIIPHEIAYEIYFSRESEKQYFVIVANARSIPHVDHRFCKKHRTRWLAKEYIKFLKESECKQ